MVWSCEASIWRDTAAGSPVFTAVFPVERVCSQRPDGFPGCSSTGFSLGRWGGEETLKTARTVCYCKRQLHCAVWLISWYASSASKQAFMNDIMAWKGFCRELGCYCLSASLYKITILIFRSAEWNLVVSMRKITWCSVERAVWLTFVFLACVSEKPVGPVEDGLMLWQFGRRTFALVSTVAEQKGNRQMSKTT